MVVLVLKGLSELHAVNQIRFSIQRKQMESYLCLVLGIRT